jgi:hypothetical protein
MRRSELGELGRSLPVRVPPWLAALRGRRRYRLLDEGALRATRRSDTIFVFGSGWSINALTDEDRARFEQHDTLGFNWFVHQRVVRMDYHLIRGIPDTDLDAAVWRPQLDEYFRLIRENPLYAETVYLVQAGLRAINGNRALGYRYLPEGSRVFLWRTNDGATLPSRSFADGLVHANSTLEECVNFAYLLGWRQIVLVGIDLYDRRYFWLDRDETRSVDVRRDATAEQPHSRAASGMIALLGRWAEQFGREGVRLSVYNAQSLLAETLPVYGT